MGSRLLSVTTLVIAMAIGVVGCKHSQTDVSGQQASSPPPENLALGKPLLVSQALAENPPEMAVDGEIGTWWSAGGYAPQWVEIDLQTQATIAQIRLIVAQTPAGKTAHRVWGLAAREEGYRLLHDFIGETEDSVVLEHTPPEPWENVRFLRVETLSSPSWVAWREIEAYDQVLPE